MPQLHNKINKDVLKQRIQESDEKRITLSFYAYHLLEDVQAFRDQLYTKFEECGVLGRIYVAGEGINGQLSVPEQNFEAFKNVIQSYDWMKDMRLNIAIEDDGKSFFKLIVRIRPKIVADGIDDPDFDPTDRGVHLDAAAFNELTNRDDVTLVDMRNHYESEVGHFEGAIKPDVDTFRESLPIIADSLADKKDKPLVMYCTGGIRCEKASAYMKQQGFEEVYQLDGGIIEYTRQVEQKGLDNKFIGKNFVFDERMAERISNEVIAKCHQCGSPCDTHINCSNDHCHILFIQCDSCKDLYDSCCSSTCQEFSKLDKDEQLAQLLKTDFPGKNIAKARYGDLNPSLLDATTSAQDAS